MIKIFILVLITDTYGGGYASFQEFNSYKQCNYVRGEILKQDERRGAIKQIFCVEK